MTRVIWKYAVHDAPKEARAFHVAGTGHPLPERFSYLGTVQDGAFVWHVLEVPS